MRASVPVSLSPSLSLNDESSPFHECAHLLLASRFGNEQFGKPDRDISLAQESELRALLEKKPNIVCYDGFEPSGRMHIAQGVMKALNVNKLTKAGCTFKFWVVRSFSLDFHLRS